MAIYSLCTFGGSSCTRRARSRAFAAGLVAGLAVLGGGLCSTVSAETIILRSGQVGGVPGAVGQPDDIMTWGGALFGSGPLSASPFTAADFNNTVSSPAVVVQPHPSWVPSLPFDPQARWVGTRLFDASFPLGAASSTLYRVPFTVTTTGITSAFITIAWACDDGLGDLLYGGANPVGAYLRDGFGNVTALTPVAGLGFGSQSLVTGYTITGAITTGLNELFLYQRDQGGAPSGTIFSAEIVVVPTPSALSVLGIGGLLASRRRR